MSDLWQFDLGGHMRLADEVAGGSSVALGESLQQELDRLPPTARDLLVAARAILSSSGIAGLTVDAVTKEAGVNKAAISYHFGSKDGLLAVVVDLALRETNLALLSAAEELPAGEDRLACFLEGKRRMAESNDAYRSLFGVIPNLLADGRLRRLMAAGYSEHLAANRQCLGDVPEASEEDLQTLARLMTAATDGLAIQRLLDGDRMDMQRAFWFLGRMFALILEDIKSFTPRDYRECSAADASADGDQRHGAERL